MDGKSVWNYILTDCHFIFLAGSPCILHSFFLRYSSIFPVCLSETDETQNDLQQHGKENRDHKFQKRRKNFACCKVVFPVHFIIPVKKFVCFRSQIQHKGRELRQVFPVSEEQLLGHGLDFIEAADSRGERIVGDGIIDFEGIALDRALGREGFAVGVGRVDDGQMLRKIANGQRLKPAARSEDGNLDVGTIREIGDIPLKGSSSLPNIVICSPILSSSN